VLALLLDRHGVLRLVFVCVYFSLLRDWSVSVLCVATSGGRTSPAVFTVKWTMRVCNICPTTQTVSAVLSHVIPYKKIWIQKHNRRKKVWYALQFILSILFPPHFARALFLKPWRNKKENLDFKITFCSETYYARGLTPPFDCYCLIHCFCLFLISLFIVNSYPLGFF
jgi:hypothetical protein